MTEYQFTPQAEADLLSIWSFIAKDSVEAADRVEEAIFAACAFIANSPEAGQVRTEACRYIDVASTRERKRPPAYVMAEEPENRGLHIETLGTRRSTRQLQPAGVNTPMV